MVRPALSPAERRDLLHARDDVLRHLAEVRERLAAANDGDAGDDDRAALAAAEARLLAEEEHWRRLYAARLPVRVVGRCPFTAIPVLYPIDDGGLDGPWWDYRGVARDWRPRPATLFALTGALERGAVEVAAPRGIVRPGPAAPYVIPRLLEHPEACAVLSALPVAGHTAYVVTYYAPPLVSDRPVTDEWGTGRWLHADGTWSASGATWDADDDGDADADAAPAAAALAEQRDFDVRPWVESGRLLWIAPDDGSATLHEGVDGCPYLDLLGERDDPWFVAEVLA